MSEIGTINYSPQIVAFIDLLGYSELIERVKNNEEESIKVIQLLLSSIENSIEQNMTTKLQPDDEELPTEPKVKIFSDCICISSDCIDFKVKHEDFTAGNVFSFLLSLMYIQAELILNNIFVRGAVTINYHYQNDKIIFSPALVRSYRLESKEAIYPRILIDQPVIDLLRQRDYEDNYQILNAIIKKDADGLAFLDYLEYIEEFDWEYDQMSYLLNHKQKVEQNLKTIKKAQVKEKYLWVARYHNQKVNRMFNKDSRRKSLLIDEKLLGISSEIFNPTCYIFKFISQNENINNGHVAVRANEKWRADEKLQKYLRNKNKDYRLDNKYTKIFESEYSKEQLEAIIREDTEVDKFIMIR
jgi:hypothetical protein